MAVRKKSKRAAEDDQDVLRDDDAEADDAGDEEADDDLDDEDEDDDEDDLDEDDDLDDEDEDDDEDDESGEHADERAAQVAKALGLGDEEEEAEDEAPKNRAARRRERAEQRRTGRRRAAPETKDESDKRSRERDRNKRLREQLLARRRDAAAQRAQPAAPGLAPSEMAEDVLVRAGASTTKWLRAHKRMVGWTVVAALMTTAAVLYYIHRSTTTTAAASDLLVRAVVADQALVIPKDDDPRTEEQKEYDPRKVFETGEARSKAALEAYDKVKAEHAGSGAAILAELGRAGVLLDQQKYDEAIAAYAAVLATELAPADADVRARALEGTAFAKEAKGDKEGARAAFEKLEGINGFKALGLYHRARLLLADDGDREEAKKLLLEARKIVEKDNIDARSEGIEGPNRWLLRVVEDRLRIIDPKSVPPRAPDMRSGPGAEQLRKLLESRGLPAPGQMPPRPPGGSGK